MDDHSDPFFLLGAGFGADAGPIVGPIEAESIYIGRFRFTCAYPLVRDLPTVCFPHEVPSVPASEVEARLGAALDAGDADPIKRLCHELSRADHYLAPPLVGWPKVPNPYSRFFGDFPSSSFATYNYDAFVEFALFRAGRWFPHDGYGVKVAANLGFTAQPYQASASKCLVLHLHGTYMVYTYNHTFSGADEEGVQWMELLEKPQFAFDPHSLGPGFHPFERFMAGLAYDPDTSSRVVAPIPNKAVGLKGAFVREVTERAKTMIAERGVLVAIGYGFSPLDRESYAALLGALGAADRPRAVVVSPDATEIVARLRSESTNIDWQSVDLGFAAWVDAGYPGLRSAV